MPNEATKENVYSPPKGEMLPENKPISELVNTNIVISAIKISPSKFGEIALFTIGGNFYRTTSAVLVKQGKDIAKMIESTKKPVTTRIEKVKQYYTFVAPK